MRLHFLLLKLILLYLHECFEHVHYINKKIVSLLFKKGIHF